MLLLLLLLSFFRYCSSSTLTTTSLSSLFKLLSLSAEDEGGGILLLPIKKGECNDTDVIIAPHPPLFANVRPIGLPGHFVAVAVIIRGSRMMVDG